MITAVGRLNSQLQRFKNDSTATLPIAIGRKEPLGLRRAMVEAPQTYGWTMPPGTSTLEQEADYLREKPEEQFRGSRVYGVTDMRRTKSRPASSRSRRERKKGFANLVHIGGR